MFICLGEREKNIIFSFPLNLSVSLSQCVSVDFIFIDLFSRVSRSLLRSLDFLGKLIFDGAVAVAIAQSNWYTKKKNHWIENNHTIRLHRKTHKILTKLFSFSLLLSLSLSLPFSFYCLETVNPCAVCNIVANICSSSQSANQPVPVPVIIITIKYTENT